MPPAPANGSWHVAVRRCSICADWLVGGWRQLLFTQVSKHRVCDWPDRFRTAVRREAAHPKRLLLQRLRGGVPRWTLGRLRFEPLRSIRDHVERYPELGNRQTISTGGGRLPLWSRNGRELFFTSLDGRRCLPFPCKPGDSRRWPSTHVVRVRNARDSQWLGGTTLPPMDSEERFLLIRSGQAEAGSGTASNLIVVQHWFEELKRLVPTK